MVQRRAARFVTRRYRNISSITDMLNYLEWETLETRRRKLQLTVISKIIHELIDIPLSEYLTPASSRTRASHSLKYQQHSTSTDCFKYSFFPPRTIPVWNRLPVTVAEAPSLASFKRELSDVTFYWGFSFQPWMYTQMMSVAVLAGQVAQVPSGKSDWSHSDGWKVAGSNFLLLLSVSIVAFSLLYDMSVDFFIFSNFTFLSLSSARLKKCQVWQFNVST